jgi:hypothetical protein
VADPKLPDKGECTVITKTISLITESKKQGRILEIQT